MAKLKAEKSTRRLLLQIQKGLPSASDPDKGMIAAALTSLLQPMIESFDSNGEAQVDVDFELQDTAHAHLRETSNMIEETQRKLDLLLGVVLLIKPAPWSR